MNVCLVFPPVWLPEAPFLSTAILTAYLKERGVKVYQRDLNVEFWQHFYAMDQIDDVYRRARSLWQQLHAHHNAPETTTQLRALLPAVGLSAERFRFEVREGIIDRDDYRDLVKVASKFSIRSLEHAPKGSEATDLYHDLLYSDISLSQHAASSQAILAMTSDDAANPYLAWFESQFLAELANERPAVLGISIAATNQVIPSFTLAHLTKHHLPDTVVVLGGSWCTQVGRPLIERLDDFTFVDAVVHYEGEEPLYRICEAVDSGQELTDIPNVVTSPRDASASVGYRANMALLPTPDFEGLPLGDYDLDETLTLQASRGCYWNRCTFCSYPLLEPAYKARPAKLVADDVEVLVQRHGARRFGFADALISPHFARALSSELLKRGLDVRWSAFARFEKAFSHELLSLMGESGCDLVSWGLESGSARILALIEKEIDLGAARRILEDANEAGIHNRVLVMYGHPTETFADAQETLRFVKRNLASIHSISFNYYHPEIGTPIERLAERFGFSLHRPQDKDLSFGYEWTSSLSADEKRQIQEEFQRISRALQQGSSSPAAGMSAFDGAPDLPHDFEIELHEEDGGEIRYLSRLSPDGDSWKREAFEIRTY